ncbi:chorismate mutase family protein [Rhizobium sp. CFBP 8762]|uniref:chorismate mutase family protein n=1 Tax=Rhizobium sp. CFBP 8762 TaxID=2775279 RepID=UPI001786E915|nr:chorismate mutase family protein [Rhizobium sp. CFBP 8762]MBD8553559.1 chorismate mutase family protein [Rhizobium sp. CFBP 8762]
MAKTAAECTSMEDIRTEIDRLDQALMALFQERWTYISRAAEIKSGLGIPADVPSRVRQVRDNARANALAHGLDPVFYEDLWERLIRHSIAHEEETLGKTG